MKQAPAPILIMSLSLVLFLSVASLSWQSYISRPTPQSAQRTPSQAAHDPVLFAGGDISSCGNTFDDETAALAGSESAAIALLGDTVYPHGSIEDFRDCFQPSWGQLKDRIRPAVGNHEYETGNAEAYFSYFGAAAGEPGQGYYSYDLGKWHVIVLNSNCTEVSCSADSPQMEWLAADLSEHTNLCTIAYYHHPRWSSGLHGSDTKVQGIWETLSDAKVDVVLSAHDHGYERFAPLDRIGEPALNGTREFVVGTGGRSLYAFRQIETGSELRLAKYYGLLRLELHRDGYSWKFLSTEGQARDQGFDRCH